MCLKQTNRICVPIYQAIDDLARESLRAEISGIEGQEMLAPSAISALGSVVPGGRAACQRRLRVTFLTPTELKNQDRPEFAPLFARIRDRISTLRALYGHGPLEIDFKAIGERAAAIRMTRCEIQPVDLRAHESHQRQRHNLGGFIGFAEYEGDLAEFIPYLEIASLYRRRPPNRLGKRRNLD